MPTICIFCTKKDKKHNGSKQKLVSEETGDFEEKIKKYATTPGDQALSSKLGRVDFVAKELHYHGICTTKYQTAAEQVSKRQQSVQSIIGTEEERFILKLSNQYAAWWMIRSLQVTMLGLKDAFNNSVSILEDLDTENLVAFYPAQKLEEKLKLRFKERIIIHKGK